MLKLDERAPRLAEGTELIGEYEGSGFKEPPYIARRADGQVVQLPELLYMLAEEIDGRRDYGELAERVTKRFGRGLDAEMTEMLVTEKLEPLGIVATQNGRQAELHKVDPLLALRLRTAVVPERVVNAVTTVFKPLFLPPVVVAVLAGMFALDVWLFGYHGIAQSIRSALYDPLFLLLILGLVVVSAAFHECGHATACAYGGARPGVMGVGVYIVWPAFYTDVTDAYRLGKRARLRTDLGGVYFNSIFTLGTAAVYFATGFEPLLLVILLQQIEIAHQFLPFIRLDGYYIVSDLTGVPDMFMRIKPTLLSLIPWRKTDEQVKELKPWVRVAVTAYVLLLVPLLLFMLTMTVINLPRILATVYDSWLGSEHRTSHAFATGDVAGAAIGIVQLIVLVLIPFGLGTTFFQLARKLVRGVNTVTKERPLLRAGAVALAAAAAAFAAYTWVPAGVYRPIQATERGTIGGGIAQIQAVPTGRPALTPARARQLQNAPFANRGHASPGHKSPTDPSKQRTTTNQTTSSRTTRRSTTTTSTGRTTTTTGTATTSTYPTTTAPATPTTTTTPDTTTSSTTTPTTTTDSSTTTTTP